MMKKILIATTLILLSVSPLGNASFAEEYYVKQTDWKSIAMKETKKRYPLAQVLFTQKIWDKTRKNMTVKQYKLTLREGNKDFGVYVTISYHPETEKIKSVQILEE
ncbi:DUF3889 domain-containing protein [Metabacillus arenae]|uniref:DUF3889 domain-containing protein n=1 Tax=Metabacillus arenae TaxID=2771434 RepID=A0A926RW53_9BACI|nr:DUF3889 domain-containing protein [Metabacillus arenae]MBD1378827.1 DUF3889 domain-containing protein [Metabacillus arenae]